MGMTTFCSNCRRKCNHFFSSVCPFSCHQIKRTETQDEEESLSCMERAMLNVLFTVVRPADEEETNTTNRRLCLSSAGTSVEAEQSTAPTATSSTDDRPSRSNNNTSKKLVEDEQPTAPAATSSTDDRASRINNNTSRNQSNSTTEEGLSCMGRAMLDVLFTVVRPADEEENNTTNRKLSLPSPGYSASGPDLSSSLVQSTSGVPPSYDDVPPSGPDLSSTSDMGAMPPSYDDVPASSKTATEPSNWDLDPERTHEAREWEQTTQDLDSQRTIFLLQEQVRNLTGRLEVSEAIWSPSDSLPNRYHSVSSDSGASNELPAYTYLHRPPGTAPPETITDIPPPCYTDVINNYSVV